MEFQAFHESPFVLKFSFEKLIEKMQHESAQNPNYALSHQKILDKASQIPELTEGIQDLDFFEKNEDLMKELLYDLFPPMLTNNEIKAIGFPFYNFFFNPTQRFQNIIKNAGENFEMLIRGLNPERFYIMSCCIILKGYYQIPFNFSMPFIFNIPDKEGITNHYRFLNNIDFMEVIPDKNFKHLTENDIRELLDNAEDYELWLSKFPPKSWQLKGFAVINFYDATTEIAVSNLKGKLINIEEDENLKTEVQEVFRSIFQVSDLEIGYTAVNLLENKFVRSPLNNIIDSFILSGISKEKQNELLSEKNFNVMVESRKYFSISDFDKVHLEFPESQLGKHFYDLGIKSAIFAPIVKDKKILGIVELVSKKKLLNSVNANKMEIVMPFLVDAMERLYEGLNTRIEAIIQREYTSIHPSVYWKFREEAERHIGFYNEEFDLPYRNIKFENLLPLYGQTDVKSSSAARNSAIQKDLIIQLSLISETIRELNKTQLEKFNDKIQQYQDLLKNDLKADTETKIQHFISTKIHPVFEELKLENAEQNFIITQYYKNLDPATFTIYQNRKNFDHTLSQINKIIADLLDKRQEEQQKIFPFYYERFKTDGVEHNMYIGSSIAPELSYSTLFLENLRLWQMRVICETEIQYNRKKPELDFPLEVTSLILVYSTPINIRFRMDEKRFDVDGSYNARYEMIKKRIDKAHLKNSDERLVQTGKLSIVFSQQKEKDDYLKYIKILQNEGLLEHDEEIISIEDLQGIIGLKAIRVSIDYHCKMFDYHFKQEL